MIDSPSPDFMACGHAAPQDQGIAMSDAKLQPQQQQALRQQCCAILRERLLLASTCCTGYDLDGQDGEGSTTAAGRSGQPGPAAGASWHSSSRGSRGSRRGSAEDAELVSELVYGPGTSSAAVVLLPGAVADVTAGPEGQAVRRGAARAVLPAVRVPAGRGGTLPPVHEARPLAVAAPPAEPGSGLDRDLEELFSPGGGSGSSGGGHGGVGSAGPSHTSTGHSSSLAGASPAAGGAEHSRSGSVSPSVPHRPQQQEHSPPVASPAHRCALLPPWLPAAACQHDCSNQGLALKHHNLMIVD